MSDFLQRILADKREEVAARQATAPVATLPAREDAPRGFGRALIGGGLSVIAEIKRRSPSKGDLRPGLDPADVARSYAGAGAAALSVLTDGPHFGGSLDDLRAARAAVRLPVLRKDFIVDPYQVDETDASGADALLLIVRALDDATLAELFDRARDRGLDVLVEVHDAAELERASRLEGALLGVNNRNLDTFVTDLATAEALRPAIPDGAVAVAESGIHEADDARRMERAGYDALLIGEAFMTAQDPGERLARLLRPVTS